MYHIQPHRGYCQRPFRGRASEMLRRHLSGQARARGGGGGGRGISS